jgi:hypothetical protein
MVTRTGLDGEVAVFSTRVSYTPSQRHPRRYTPVGGHAANPVTTSRSHPRRITTGGPAALAGT